MILLDEKGRQRAFRRAVLSWEVAGPLRNHLNCGIVGRLMRGGGSGILWKSFRPRSGRPPHCSFHQHLLGPAGSTDWHIPVAAEPACRANPAEPPCARANDAAGEAKTIRNAKATLPRCST